MTTTLAPASVTPTLPLPPADTIAEMLERLGDVPAWRVRATPPPGTATERDIFAVRDATGKLCELIDGVLVEKAMGYRESFLAAAIIELLRQFVRPRRLGIVLAPDATLRLLSGRVRMPDVSFLSWDRLPDRKMPTVRVLDAAPDLAIEIVSESNTRQELAIKRREYFASGTALVWQIDPKTRTAEVYSAPDAATKFDDSATLDGDPVLPGFTLSLADLFGELDEEGPPLA